MWRRITLKTRIFTILIALLVISFIGGGTMVWYTYRMETLLTGIINKHLASYEAAEKLETALVNQKGFVSYYFMDGDADWLRQLGEYRQIFKERLIEAQRLAENGQQQGTLLQIEKEYNRYIAIKDKVIDHYRAGRIREGAHLHQTVRDSFFSILELCEEYKKIHKNMVMQVQENSHSHAQHLRFTAAGAVGVSFLLVAGLVFFLINQILGPIHRLAMDANRESKNPQKNQQDDDINSLHKSVHGLLEDVDSTRQELEKSREHLVQSEKLALVGKLAAGMAHSLRNPFTSVKMRLFSLNRTLELSESQKDDFNVISDEIRHIDTIVQNFLEFSRPPKLQMQNISPSTVVDQALQLLTHRLKSYRVDISVDRPHPLPFLFIDAEQLKEVLVNIIINACEAMINGGHIVIRECIETHPTEGEAAVINLTDNGPGIPNEFIEKIFNPFFTTKEEGTGLGLSIAVRIIEEHHGSLEVESSPGNGTTFRILLPLESATS